MLESFGLGARLGRGRSYARRGQVLDIDIEKGRVRARVQGSRSEPYRVTIKVKALPAPVWRRVVSTLGREARLAARLLAGELPEDVEGAFRDASASLFPERGGDLSTECSCPDWSNPCKHIGAVYYLLGEEFDRDPFLILKLRGLPREELLRQLRAPGMGRRRKEPAVPIPHEAEAAASPPEPLRAEPSAFWAGGELPPDPSARSSCPRPRPRSPGASGGSPSGAAGLRSWRLSSPSTSRPRRGDWRSSSGLRAERPPAPQCATTCT